MRKETPADCNSLSSFSSDCTIHRKETPIEIPDTANKENEELESITETTSV